MESDISDCLDSDDKKEILLEIIRSFTILSPEDGEVTDKDSDNENDGMLKYLTSAQLQSNQKQNFRKIMMNDEKIIKANKIKKENFPSFLKTLIATILILTN